MCNEKVGIYIPTYNRAKLIGKTIESILNQTYSNFVLTIVDNDSTDETEEIVNNFKDKRIKYIKNEKNIGAIKNINKCFELAIKNNENYVAIYHSDDEYYNNIVEKELNYLNSNEKVEIVFANSDLIDENGNKIYKNEEKRENIILNYKKLLFRNLKGGTPLVCPTFMCKKEVLKSNNQFDENLIYAGDTEYYLRISRKFNIGILGEPLIKYRISDVQETKKQINEIGTFEEFIVLNKEINYYKENFGEIPSDIIIPYNKRLSAEYLRDAINLINIDYKKFSKQIKRYILNSINLYRYPIYKKNGIKQVLIKNKLYFLYRLLEKNNNKGYSKKA